MTADASSTWSSLLDLLHPSGRAGEVSVLGGGRLPPFLWGPILHSAADTERSDAILVVPDSRECRTPAWLAEAAVTVGRRLAPDGVAYAVVPPRWRWRFLRLLRREGLVIDSANVHLRAGSSSYYIIPCDAWMAAHTLWTTSLRPVARHLAAFAAVVATPDALLQHTCADVGVAVRRPGARPLFQWTCAIAPAAGLRTAMIRTKQRGNNTTAVITLFQQRSRVPLFTLKVPITPASEVARRHEAEMIDALEPAATRAGALLPSAHVVDLRYGRWLLCSHVVPGISAAAALASSPARLSRVVADLAAWLARWSVLTERAGAAHPDPLERDVLRPARALAPFISSGAEYVSWLRRECEQASGSALPVVATHNDLTMTNVLLSSESGLGVLDWESAREDGLPLVDLFYAAADARAATSGYRDRTAAFLDTCDPHSEYGHLVTDLAARLCEAVRLPQRLMMLLRHASALQHAADEQREPRPGPQPYLDLVQWLWRAERARGAAA